MRREECLLGLDSDGSDNPKVPTGYPGLTDNFQTTYHSENSFFIPLELRLCQIPGKLSARINHFKYIIEVIPKLDLIFFLDISDFV